MLWAASGHATTGVGRNDKLAYVLISMASPDRNATKPSRTTHLFGGTMAQDAKQIVRLELNDRQKRQVAAATGLAGEFIELTVEELEDRVMPRLSSNHNETLLRFH
jgi:hypothetical protein